MVPRGLALKTLIQPDAITERVPSLATRYQWATGVNPCIFCCVLKGAFIFAVDLIRHIKCPLRVDFVLLASYGDNMESGGKVKIIKDVELSFENCHVLIVEDIVNTGITMKFLVDHLKLHHPKSVRICTMLDKKSRCVIDVPIDYAGFTIKDGFVVGHGLDYAEYHREL